MSNRSLTFYDLLNALRCERSALNTSKKFKKVSLVCQPDLLPNNAGGMEWPSEFRQQTALTIILHSADHTLITIRLPFGDIVLGSFVGKVDTPVSSEL